MRAWMTQLSIAVLMAALMPMAPAAARPLERHFGAQDSCYQRTYGNTHLSQHRDQRVTEIRFEHFPNVYGTYDANDNVRFDARTGEVHFVISTKTRDSYRFYSNSGTCRPEGDHYRCYLECDGGWFVLKDNAPKSILIVNEEGFVIDGCEGDGDDVDVRTLKPGRDDKAFRLDRVADDLCVAPILKSE